MSAAFSLLGILFLFEWSGDFRDAGIEVNDVELQPEQPECPCRYRRRADRWPFASVDGERPIGWQTGQEEARKADEMEMVEVAATVPRGRRR